MTCRLQLSLSFNSSSAERPAFIRQGPFRAYVFRYSVVKWLVIANFLSEAVHVGDFVVDRCTSWR